MTAYAPAPDATKAAGKLQGKVAVVVGASRGMGRAIALGYAREGAEVVVIARSTTELNEVAAEAASFGQRCIPIVADARDGQQMKDPVTQVVEEFGRVDILVHAVGGGLSATALERPALLEELNANCGADFWRIEDQDFDSILALDFKSALMCCKYFAPIMIEQHSGSIVVLGSYGGIMGSRGWKDAASQACKAGVHRFVAAMADELRPYKVAANILLPGLTLTTHTGAIKALRERATQKPEDVVDAAVFLAKQDEDGMTGRFVEANPSAARLPTLYMPIAHLLAGDGARTSSPPVREETTVRVPALSMPAVRPAAVLARAMGAAGLAATQWTRHSGRALLHPSFRLFFAGQGVSLPGTWMQRMAVAWLAYQLTGSALMLGALEFAFQIPALVFGPVAGVAADRWSRKTLLIWTQGLSMLLAAVLAGLVFGGSVGILHLAVFSVLQGTLTGFDQTARRSLMFDMVEADKADLASAIALNSALQMGARTVGPAIGGILIAAFGGAVCFALNAVSYLPIIAALAMMRISAPLNRERQMARPGGLLDGLRYTLGTSVIRDALALLAVGSLFGISFVVLLPLVSSEVLGGGPQVFGLLAAAFGAGSLVGAAYVAGYTSTARLQWLGAAGVALLGLGLVGLASTQALWYAVMFIAIAGFGGQLLLTGTNTLVQTYAADDKRGRVMSWYTTAFNGSVPFGSLGAGAFAGVLGIGTTLLLGGVVCFIGAAAASLRVAQSRWRAAGAPAELASLGTEPSEMPSPTGPGV